ncbi:MAG: glutamate--tRNA ligase family protein, partial [Patescibacteria group bacterium]|nr:glutamate--tRNA ligase family protein [Patescibacteria group bacterium]
PLYNFTAVIDDFEMKISHVLRGEEHLSNTPKQIIIAEALGLPSPHFAHLPLILGPDRKKLSKRFLSASVDDFHRDGYLPQAILNFLVLLGWHPTPDREVINAKEMIKEFDIKRVQKAGAIYNPEKLEWLNAHYIKTLDNETLLKELKPFLPPAWLENKTLLKKIIEIEKERIKKLNELPRLAGLFFELPDYPAELLIWKGSSNEQTVKNLKSILKILDRTPTQKFLKNSVEKEIFALAEKEGRGEVLWPLRVALSGQQASPGPIEILIVLGKKESEKRIKLALNKISPEDSLNNPEILTLTS